MKDSPNTSNLLLSRLAQFSRLSAKAIEGRLNPLGINLQEMRVAGLMMGEEEITKKELAAKLSVRAATLSFAITKLAKQGLVERRQSAADKRCSGQPKLNHLAIHCTISNARRAASFAVLWSMSKGGLSSAMSAMTQRVPVC